MEYDWKQDWEQLDKTMLSLTTYYEKARRLWRSPNEAEFWAYWIVFRIQAQFPAIENKIQHLPSEILNDPRVQTALKIYMSAQNNRDVQGPVLFHNQEEPRQLVAPQQNWVQFFKLVGSYETPFLLACCAEIYFTLVRRTALRAMIRSFRRQNLDWAIEDATEQLGFDSITEMQEFIENYHFTTAIGSDGRTVIDFRQTTSGQDLPDPINSQQQTYSKRNVEIKREGRSYPAILSGLSIRAAREAGLIDQGWTRPSIEDINPRKEESMFVTGNSDDEVEASEEQTQPQLNPSAAPFQPSQPPSGGGISNPFGPRSFSQPSTTANPFAPSTISAFKSPFAEESPKQSPTEATGSSTADAAPSAPGIPSFNFTLPTPTGPATTPTVEEKKPLFAFAGNGAQQPAQTVTTGAEEKKPLFSLGETGARQPAQTETAKAPSAFNLAGPKPGSSNPFGLPASATTAEPEASAAPEKPATANPFAALMQPKPPATQPAQSVLSSTTPAEPNRQPTVPAASNPFASLMQQKLPAAQPTQSVLSSATPAQSNQEPTTPANSNLFASLKQPTTTKTAPKLLSSTPSTFFAPALKPSTSSSSTLFPSLNIAAPSVVGPSTEESTMDGSAPLTSLLSAAKPAHQATLAPTPTFALNTTQSPTPQPTSTSPFDRISTPTTIKPSLQQERDQRVEDSLKYLSTQILIEPKEGFLTDILQKKIRRVVKKEMRRVKLIEAKEKAVKIERGIIARKFFYRWYEQTRELRLKRQAKKRREKAKAANRASRESSSLTGLGKEFEAFKAKLEEDKMKRTEDAMAGFDHSQDGVAQPNALQQPAAGARAMPPPSSTASLRRHERMSVRANQRAKAKATIVARTPNNADFRVSKPGTSSVRSSQPSQPQGDKLTAFLEAIRGPLPGDGGIITTRTNYFRYKAFGVHNPPKISDDYKNRSMRESQLRESQLRESQGSSNGLRSSFNSSFGSNARRPPPLDTGKRKREEDVDGYYNSAISPPDAKRPLRIPSSPIGNASLRSSTGSLVEKGHLEHEDLMARVRAVRENLAEGEHFFVQARQNLEQEEEALRASGRLAKPPLKKLPEFYFRESRFIPKEMYGKWKPREEREREAKAKAKAEAEKKKKEQEEAEKKRVEMLRERERVMAQQRQQRQRQQPQQQQRSTNPFAALALAQPGPSSSPGFGGAGGSADDAIELDSD
jgi:SAC3/GANP family